MFKFTLLMWYSFCILFEIY